MHKKHSNAADLLGLSRLTIHAVQGVADIAEALHRAILHQTLGKTAAKPLTASAGIAYSGVRGVARLVGGGIDAVLGPLVPLLGKQQSWAGREALLAAINGVLGDHLERQGNPLAIQMALRRGGVPLWPQDAEPGTGLPAANAPGAGRILLLAHGLCMNDLQWQRAGHDHGAALAQARGYTPVYLHYNTGRHISSNGRDLSALLESLVARWPVPVEELVFLCHSMGGLVARSACHQAAEAGHGWLRHLRGMVFLGTPHHGAPLERGGNWFHTATELSRFSAPFSRLAKIRSAGITDLRHGCILERDWQDRDRFADHSDPRQPAPLPPGVRCHTVAATTGQTAGDWQDTLLGDGLVPLASALGRHPDPAMDLGFAPDAQWVACQTNHMDLLNDRQVYQRLLDWL